MHKVLNQIFNDGTLIHAVISGPCKIEIRPVLIKEKNLYQITEHIKNKAIHNNVDGKTCLKLLEERFLKDFKQAVFFTAEADFQLLANKKGEIKILRKAPSKKLQTLSHNKEKNYLLPEGKPLPFLIELGLMNDQGRVYPQKMAKFRQINRFLEMVEDTGFDTSGTIIDFGCGKAYLTFALFYYYRFVKKLDIRMIGLDLKEDVIEFCSKLSKKLGYEGLSFAVGDIADFNPPGPVSMVVALHACDTATDAALAQAIKWKSRVILAAPCCQHELFKQIKSDPLKGILRYGLLKERFAALVTDAARSLILEMKGYSTQILEFIDPEETPKNLLIRGVLGNTPEKRQQAQKDYQALKESLNIAPSLERLNVITTSK